MKLIAITASNTAPNPVPWTNPIDRFASAMSWKL